MNPGLGREQALPNVNPAVPRRSYPTLFKTVAFFNNPPALSNADFDIELVMVSRWASNFSIDMKPDDRGSGDVVATKDSLVASSVSR